MSVFEFSMLRSDRTSVQLAEIADLVPPNDWVWNILHYEGMGGALAGYAPLDFEKATRTGTGVELTSAEFLVFVTTVGDVWWMVAVAQSPTQRISTTDVERRDFSRSALILEAEDSGRWIVRSPSGDPLGNEAVRRISATYSQLAL